MWLQFTAVSLPALKHYSSRVPSPENIVHLLRSDTHDSANLFSTIMLTPCLCHTATHPRPENIVHLLRSDTHGCFSVHYGKDNSTMTATLHTAALIAAAASAASDAQSRRATAANGRGGGGSYNGSSSSTHSKYSNALPPPYVPTSQVGDGSVFKLCGLSLRTFISPSQQPLFTFLILSCTLTAHTHTHPVLSNISPTNHSCVSKTLPLLFSFNTTRSPNGTR